ncbi:transposase family protein [Moorena sp. SIOASIH]|uniref:transposase family protein n=1 Tax=Moorena sp. SIOASIH TaxID=2607817 RepID=UPI0025EB570F|nr:transposase family protein [Moorena sp. SIOASIH]
MSDIKICRKTLSKFNAQQTFSGDKAYIGETQITTPYKKPKNGELTESQKQENKALSSDRIFIENLIRVVKILKRSQERFRLRKTRYQSVLFVNGLWISTIKKRCSAVLGRQRGLGGSPHERLPWFPRGLQGADAGSAHSPSP